MSNEYQLTLTKIEDARNKNNCNLLIPSIPLEKPSNDLFVPILETVYISTDIENGKEIYKGSDNKHYRLHAKALQKIAIAGSIKWNSMQSGFVKDPTKNVTTFRAVGGILKADGDMYSVAGYYDMDLDVLREDLIENYTEKAKRFEDKSEKEQKEYVNYCVNRDFRAKRQHQLKLCETGAKNRVIRELFNIKSEYTLKELNNPFLVLRFKLRMDYQDPEVRRLVLSAQISAALGIFGPSQPTALQAPIDVDFTTADIADDPNIKDPDAPPPQEESPPFTEHESAEIDFMNSDDQQQVAALKNLADKTGTKLSDVRLSPEQKSKRLDLYKYLKSLPQSEPEPDYDDIPF
jgi:hypothetical protein